MNSATLNKPLPPMPTSERNECPACETQIPHQYVFNRFDFEQSPPTRSVTIYCAHCNVFYERNTELRGGVWVSSDEGVKVTTHARRLEALRKKVAEIGRITFAQSA
jgi:hypothetical protein